MAAASARRTTDGVAEVHEVVSGRADAQQHSAGATLDPRAVNDIVRRVVDVASPEKIILFGSAARGEMTRHSDVDLLVVKEGADALDLMGQIYMGLRGVGAAVDVIVVSPGDIERYKDSHALVIKPTLRKGRVVYDAA